jgi:replicative DNA helicase Mcm
MADAALASIIERFDEFFDSYYGEAISDMIIGFPETRSLKVDIKELEKFDPELASEAVEKPDYIMEAAEESLRKRLVDIELGDWEVHVRFFGQTINTPLVQDVGSRFINKMIMLDSLVIKRSEINPRVKRALYKCTFCGATLVVKGRDEPPEVCPQCKRRSMKQDDTASSFVNFQKVAVQDPLEKLRGNTPTWQLEVWIHDDLVNTVLPGERVEVTGVLKIRQKRNAKGKADKDLFVMYLDTVSIVPKQKEFSDIAISEEEERGIKELAKDPAIFQNIAKSIVPSIYGYDEIKEAVALQLFGGTQGKTLVDGGAIRSDMHLLLIGDPGSAKTRILQAVAKLVPKGIYVSGKSITGGGMTAVAERDEFAEGGWTLKAGALVLGSGGIVAIDEFDKVGEDDRASLHEALESQTVSVAKAGIIATFRAKAAVLAAANPKYGRFDPNSYPAEQFDIPVTLLSRFDLIFPIRDTMDEAQDRNIAKHILMQHEAAGSKIAEIRDYKQVESPPLDSELLRKYIAYARTNVSPRLSEEASQKIQTYYIELRRAGAKSGKVAITPRQIEGLVRMAEASAKTRLADIVEVSDAERAIQLSEYMLKTLALDSGRARDIDIILTGMPREKVDKINTMMGIIKRLEQSEGSAKIDRVYEEAEKEGMDRMSAERYIGELERSGDLFKPRQGIVKSVRHDDE